MGLSPISLPTSQIQSRMRLKFRHSDRFMFLNIRDYQETMKVFSLIRLQLAGAQGQTRTGTPKQKFLRLPSLPFHHLGKSHLGVAHHPSSFTGRFFHSNVRNLAKTITIRLTVSVWSINTIKRIRFNPWFLVLYHYSAKIPSGRIHYRARKSTILGLLYNYKLL